MNIIKEGESDDDNTASTNFDAQLLKSFSPTGNNQEGAGLQTVTDEIIGSAMDEDMYHVIVVTHSSLNTQHWYLTGKQLKNRLEENCWGTAQVVEPNDLNLNNSAGGFNGLLVIKGGTHVVPKCETVTTWNLP